MVMIDRKKVINGLRCIKGDLILCVDCAYSDGNGHGTYSCKAFCANDALALLKEQEHVETFTVIDTKTGEEADTYEIALHEDWAKHLCYCDMEGWAIEDDGTLLLVDECGKFAYADRERFKVVWDA